MCSTPGHNARTCPRRRAELAQLDAAVDDAAVDVVTEVIAPAPPAPRPRATTAVIPGARPAARACRRCGGGDDGRAWVGLDLCAPCVRGGVLARRAERAAEGDEDEDDDDDDDLSAEPAPVRGELPAPRASFSMGGGLMPSAGGGPRGPRRCTACGELGHRSDSRRHHPAPAADAAAPTT